jgi:membrane protein YqaA with SNARE-associated domain
MWAYAACFLAAVAVDSIPVFAPPAWPILVFFLVHYDLNPWAVILLGVSGTTLGRAILTTYICRLGHKVLDPCEEKNLQYLGSRLSGASAFAFVCLYSLTPLSTTALFTAAGMAKVKLRHLLPPFFLGKLTSYSVLIWTGQYVATDPEGLFSGMLTWKGVLTALLGFVLLLGVLFIDWKKLLREKEFRLNFRIWKTSRA